MRSTVATRRPSYSVSLPIGWWERAAHWPEETSDELDLTITYDKPGQRLHLAATITPELLPVVSVVTPSLRSKKCYDCAHGPRCPDP
jgi:hypothetical protein